MKNVLIMAFVFWASMFHGVAEEEHSVGTILDSTTISGSVDTTISFPGSSLQITFQPRNTSALRNGPAEFSVAATGGQPISYQWFRDGVAVTGATTATLAIPHVGDSDLGAYTVGVTEGLFTYMTKPVALVYAELIPLTVHPAAELEAFLEHGKFYQIQFSENLVSWSDQGRVIQGTGLQRLFLQSSAGLAASFFRIKVTDAIPGGAASMTSKHLTLNITKGVVTGTFQFDFTASDYTGTHGTDTLSGIYFYSLEGSVGDLSFHLPNLEVQDSYLLIFTSPGEFILRGSQRATDGSFGQVEGTGTLH